MRLDQQRRDGAERDQPVGAHLAACIRQPPDQARGKEGGATADQINQWDVLLPLKAEIDGLKLNTIFFNRRELRSGFLKGAEFGTRAQIDVRLT